MGYWFVSYNDFVDMLACFHANQTADFDPRVAVKANWGLWAVRGKRYDILGPQWDQSSDPSLRDT